MRMCPSQERRRWDVEGRLVPGCERVRIVTSTAARPYLEQQRLNAGRSGQSTRGTCAIAASCVLAKQLEQFARPMGPGTAVNLVSCLFQVNNGEIASRTGVPCSTLLQYTLCTQDKERIGRSRWATYSMTRTMALLWSTRLLSSWPVLNCRRHLFPNPKSAYR